MALIDRIDVDKDNHISINLRLDPDVIRVQPNLQQGSSHLPELPLLSDSLRGLLGKTTEGRRNSHFVSVETGVEGVKVSINSTTEALEK